MPYYKFGPNDIFRNVIKAYPKCEFHIYDGLVYYNKNTATTGSTGDRVTHVPPGHINVYEMNVNRADNQQIYPFVTKEGTLTAFRTVSTSNFNSDFSYGGQITGSYPLSASISSQRFTSGETRARVLALKNTLNSYTSLSRHYTYSSASHSTYVSGGLIKWNKGKDELRLISVPSIFYGSSIKKGSVDLKFYISGTMAARIRDKNRNGELIEVTGSNSGAVAGVVLYNEGFLVMTGAWALSDHTEAYNGTSAQPRWIDFATTASLASSSFSMQFSGTTYTPVMTMMADAPMGKLNHSNNPTYIKYGQTNKLVNPVTGASIYKEYDEIKIKNTVKSDYAEPTASFRKQTWISKIGIYDEDRNLIAIAKLANPVKKTEERDYTFKLKLDI